MTPVAIDSQRYIARNVLCASISGVLLVAGVSVQAQETNGANNLERITVTGSNIPRTDTETASPVEIITREDIARSGRTTIAEYLQTLTVDGQGSIPKTFGGGFAMGGLVSPAWSGCRFDSRVDQWSPCCYLRFGRRWSEDVRGSEQHPDGCG